MSKRKPPAEWRMPPALVVTPTVDRIMREQGDETPRVVVASLDAETAAIRKVKIAGAILAYAAGSAIVPLGAYVKIPASLWSAVRALAEMEIDS